MGQFTFSKIGWLRYYSTVRYRIYILLQNDFRDPLVHIKPGDIRFSSELVLNPLVHLHVYQLL